MTRERAGGAGGGAGGDHSVIAYVGLGSNLGDRRAAIDRACESLRAHPGVLEFRVSSIRETEPVGEPGAPATGGPYLNAVAELRTDLSALDLLELCLEIEARLGRVRGARNEPRTIDLDVLLYGDARIDVRSPAVQSALVVPHPRLCERRFVLEPLVELCPDRAHPESGRNMRELLDELPTA